MSISCFVRVYVGGNAVVIAVAVSVINCLDVNVMPLGNR